MIRVDATINKIGYQEEVGIEVFRRQRNDGGTR
jgi:hypothetical protein